MKNFEDSEVDHPQSFMGLLSWTKASLFKFFHEDATSNIWHNQQTEHRTGERDSHEFSKFHIVCGTNDFITDPSGTQSFIGCCEKALTQHLTVVYVISALLLYLQ